MINPTNEILAQAVAMKADGQPWKAILAETGLNYSQAWLAVETEKAREAGLLIDDATSADVAKLRNKDKISWGLIAVYCQMSESKARRLFTEATELKSQGLRIGKGGRFYYGPDRGAPLYQDELRPTGTEIPKDAKYEGAIAAADSMKMIHWDMPQLKARCEELGIKVPAKPTKANLVQKIRKAQSVAA